MLLEFYFLGIFSYIICMFALFLKVDSDEEMRELIHVEELNVSKKEVVTSLLYVFCPIVHWIFAAIAVAMVMNNEWWNEVKGRLRDR